MPVSERTKRIIWTQAGGTCSVCREILLELAVGTIETHLLGEVAHIIAEQIDGPRGQSPLSLEQRNLEGNLRLVCLDHHRIIDDDPISYPVQKLQEIKANHIAWVACRLRLEHPWTTKLHNFYYINVPRLTLLSATAGMSLDLSPYGTIEALHILGWELNGLMLQFKELLAKIELKAIDLAAALELQNESRGMLVSFDRDFRTKNIKKPESLAGYRRAVLGDLKRDPHIYTNMNGIRVIFTIDPRWITTTTAFVQFTSGRNKFGGLGIVNSFDMQNKSATVTPLVLGLPSNPFLETFYEGLRTK